LKKVLAQHSLRNEVFYLCYNTKQMLQYGHWKRQRGLANSKTLEQVLLVYKGKVPKNMPKTRQHVDANSSLFNQIVRNVPVLAPKNQAYVSRAVREASLNSMTGIPHDEDEGEKEKAKTLEEDDESTGLNQRRLNQPDEAEERAFVAAHVKKRKLYRQLSGTDVPWFPHDNDPDLLKELCWEAGTPRWVFHGTPSGGAGIHGCFEMGCSVVALCFDEHHREHLNKFLLQRAVEAMVSGTTMVFKDDILQARSAELHLAQSQHDSKKDKKKEKKESAPDKKEKQEQGEEGEGKVKKDKNKEKKKGHKKALGKKPKEKAAPRSDTSSSSGVSESSESDSAPSLKKPKKS
jgi:hypothetical protein